MSRNSKFRDRKQSRCNNNINGKRPRRRNELIDDDCSRELRQAKGDKFPQERVKTSNDPQWYFKDKQILYDVASFSFNQPTGNKLHFNKYHVPNPSVDNLRSLSSVPGVLSITVGPTCGVGTDAQSPVNLGATNVYSFVRYKNSGSANYDSPDLMLYLIAMDSLYAAWNWMKRIYGYATVYSQRNKYMPRAYAELENVDLDDIMSNLADFRGWLNIKSQEIAAFCVPATMNYMVRHSWLFSNIFTDSNTAKAQQYMYTPAWFYQYDEMSSPQGGILKPVVVNMSAPSAKWNFQSLQKLLNGMLEAVNYSEDIGIMSGDILKAYGESGLFTLSLIPDDYRVDPVYSQEVLTQIENAQPVSLGSDVIEQFTIRQNPDTNYITCQPKFLNYSVPRSGGYLNFHWDGVTPEQVMVASRLKPALVQSETSAVITSMGSELATGATIAQFLPSGKWSDPIVDTAALDIATYNVPFTVYPNLTTLDEAAVAQYFGCINALFSFDWGPEMIFGYASQGDNNLVYHACGTTRDWDNYVYIDNHDMESMNTVALLSEFNVPN